ncbi:helix-turn-helix domain-containing protein [Chitinophaga arvensicola]|uniref:AraC-like ligand binding domain-containing protein n=1 Tax=Chitinophaga arvensicola TaxID=29529 RepID=A0A1I0S732_9BACT|nr:helix-turn-helix domain-containing protein [Chitinophaga arvensicola]SEW51546.1 AraC-like ligand binding domain-containing protein [Chitinophaga arvensicola]
MLKKMDGFTGQKAIVIPKKILRLQCESSPLIADIHITHIGYYPRAEFHYRKRNQGAEQHILIYCLDGKGHVKVKGEEYEILPGDFFIVPQNEQHIYGANPATPWTIYWIHFAGTAADEIINMMMQKFGILKGSVGYSLQRTDIFDAIFRQLERGYDKENFLFANMSLKHFLASFLFADKFKSDPVSSGTDVVNRSIDFMQQHIHNMLTLADMARHVNLSPSHFSFLFKQKTGFSPIEYFNYLKVQRACEYLEFTDMRIKEIAINLGIEDPYYFSRFFSKAMGLSPADYRKKKIWS